MKRPETVQTEKHEKPKMKKTAVLSRLLPYLMRYKFLMLGAILLTVGGNLLALAGPYISGLAVDAMELGRGKVNFEKVGCYAVLMVVMYAMSAALSYALTRLMIVISRRVVNTMRHDVFQKLSELPVGYFDTHQTGDILSRMIYRRCRKPSCRRRTFFAAPPRKRRKNTAILTPKRQTPTRRNGCRKHLKIKPAKNSKTAPMQSVTGAVHF